MLGNGAFLTAALRLALLTLTVLAAPPSALLAAPPGAEEAGAEEAGEDAAEPGFPRVEVHGLVDVRFAATGDQTAWLDGGLGRTRYGGPDRDRDGRASGKGNAFHAGQLSLVVDGRIREDLLARLHLNADPEEDRRGLLDPVGVVEAFVAWTPVLSPSARLRLRGGITVPPFSLEHPEVAWSTRYTITPSAIGSWLGEEVKSTGAEGTLVLSLPSFTELELQGGAFSGNDATGALLAWRGWALHDRQGQMRDELPLPPIIALTDERFFAGQGTRTAPFVEVDGRPGWHAQARVRAGARGMLQGGYYDNRGDVSSVEPRSYTWHTSFAVAGAEATLGPLTLVGQLLDGRTRMGFVDPKKVDAPFRAGFVLASVQARQTRLSGRYDRFSVRDRDAWKEGKDLNTENGWAATAAWIQGLGDRHALEAEYLHVHVDHPFATTAGERNPRNDRQFQAGFRLRF